MRSTATSFAILAGLATAPQAQSALTYIDRTMTRSYGNSVADTNGWNGSNWDYGDTARVYPFISYFEVLARYAAGADASALELIKREWGFMAQHGPGRCGRRSRDEPAARSTSVPSYDHGWSSGAAPALTNYVLGVQPTSPGFATFTVTPHPSGLTSAPGVVPTPHGPIRVSWSTVPREARPGHGSTAPAGTTWTNPPARRPRHRSGARATTAASRNVGVQWPRRVRPGVRWRLAPQRVRAVATRPSGGAV